MQNADKIRIHSAEKYVLPARRQKMKRFSIRAGDVVRELGMNGRVPAVCSALKGHKFLQRNNLRLIEISGPKSGQSTTVTYTYEFVEATKSDLPKEDPWIRLRGALQNVFAELGGGEAYLRKERDNFYPPTENQ
jgi:5-methylcytosine-specific restriction enzyme B